MRVFLRTETVVVVILVLHHEWMSWNQQSEHFDVEFTFIYKKRVLNLFLYKLVVGLHTLYNTVYVWCNEKIPKFLIVLHNKHISTLMVFLFKKHIEYIITVSTPVLQNLRFFKKVICLRGVLFNSKISHSFYWFLGQFIRLSWIIGIEQLWGQYVVELEKVAFLVTVFPSFHVHFHECDLQPHMLDGQKWVEPFLSRKLFVIQEPCEHP